MLTLLSIAFLLLIAYGLGSSLHSLQAGPVREEYLRVVRAMRWWMVPLAVAGLVVVVTVYAVLITYGPTWMAWGWWSALGGEGNVNLGQTGNEGLFWSVTGWLIPVGVALAVPLLARQEEVWFRRGTENFTVLQTLARSLVFGLVHLLAGIPIGAALALTVSGLLFAGTYRVAYDRPRMPALVAAPEINWGEYEAISDTGERLAWLGERLSGFDAQVASLQQRNRIRAEWEADWDRARERATDVAAAMHTVSNWCAIGLLLALLAFT
ncbi:hypothetical protein [Modestobacter sp. SSW1-42]|uniref:hypothetical protein n=1 Tax=Modestobacter sp. SSW1-42 TaxID=596372 RepID=UPI003986D582